MLSCLGETEQDRSGRVRAQARAKVWVVEVKGAGEGSNAPGEDQMVIAFAPTVQHHTSTRNRNSLHQPDVPKVRHRDD